MKPSNAACGRILQLLFDAIAASLWDDVDGLPPTPAFLQASPPEAAGGVGFFFFTGIFQTTIGCSAPVEGHR